MESGGTERSSPAEVADTESDKEAPDRSRREALLRMSAYAAAIAPAMVVLTSGRANAAPPCNVPAWEQGLKNKGHSGC